MTLQGNFALVIVTVGSLTVGKQAALNALLHTKYHISRINESLEHCTVLRVYLLWQLLNGSGISLHCGISLPAHLTQCRRNFKARAHIFISGCIWPKIGRFLDLISPVGARRRVCLAQQSHIPYAHECSNITDGDACSIHHLSWCGHFFVSMWTSR